MSPRYLGELLKFSLNIKKWGDRVEVSDFEQVMVLVQYRLVWAFQNPLCKNGSYASKFNKIFIVMLDVVF